MGFPIFFQASSLQSNRMQPPCREFSTALTTQARDLDQADKVVMRCLEIIEYLQPELWWVENPRIGI